MDETEELDVEIISPKPGRPPVPEELQCGTKIQLYLENIFYKELVNVLGEKCLSKKIREILHAFVMFTWEVDANSKQYWGGVYQKVASDKFCETENGDSCTISENGNGIDEENDKIVLTEDELYEIKQKEYVRGRESVFYERTIAKRSYRPRVRRR